jgi:hypothetical protein
MREMLPGANWLRATMYARPARRMPKKSHESVLECGIDGLLPLISLSSFLSQR